ncbi:MAG: class I SAM-dependent methyltransferase [Methylococcaceae bacterium]|nr:class I SAM-dependent methyltransferase [Methylococcaceae bacterium]
MTNPCNVCHSTDFDELSNVGRDGTLRTVICKNCSLVWSDPFPIDTTEYYQKNYRILYKGTYSPKIKHIYRAANVAVERYKRLSSHLVGKEKVLEIGSGGGEFSYLLTKKGFDVSAIEPNEGYGNYSKEKYGLNIQIGFAQNLEFAVETFDFITMSHVLEHVDNPTTMLEKLRTWLKPNGILALEVPNVEAVCQSPKSTFHTAHLFNFNPETLALLAEKTGFSVVQSVLSDDGGNLTLIAQKTDAVKPSLAITGNYEKVFAIVKNHTTLNHYLSPFPYSRLIGKVRKILDERQAVAKFTDAKDVLDSCYK